MAAKVNVSMPQDLDLDAGWTLQVTAVDSSGSTVSGVNVSNLSITADAPLGNVSSLEVGPFMLVPGPNA